MPNTSVEVTYKDSLELSIIWNAPFKISYLGISTSYVYSGRRLMCAPKKGVNIANRHHK